MWRKVLITLGILCFLSGAKAQADDVYAYCPLGEGYVFLYDSPAGFQVIANVKCGAKLTVVDASDKDRMRVRTADGKEGYVQKSSITAPPSSAQRQPAASPNNSAPQPKLPPPPTPISQPPAQPQPKSQPEPKAQAQAELTPAQSQPAQAPPAPAQPAHEQPKQAEAQALPEPQPQALPLPQRQEQPELTAQPEPQPQLEARSEPVASLPAEPTPEEQPKPEAKPKAKSKPELKAERQSRTQQPPQPQPAATGFTPFSTLGYEQTIPRLELYGGYMFLNAGTSGLASRQNVSGVESSVAFHVNRWLAGEADFGLGYKSLQIVNPTTGASVGTFPFHDYLALAGPRFNIHKAFFHALAGIDHLAGSNNFYAITTTLADNTIAAAAGGGVQWNVSRRLALRTSGDYVMTRFERLMQHNVRVTVGIVFQMGSVEAR